MSLKSAELAIDRPGRDQGKRFSLSEMPAKKAERWALRALWALSQSKADLPLDMEQMRSMGAAAFVGLSLRALIGIPDDIAAELLDEALKRCVTFISSSGVKRPLIDNGTEGDDIEEIATRVQIYKALLELHTGFSIPAGK